MKVAIVGAGVSGLASIRKALDFGVECIAYEITENIGGTWVYYDDVRDEFRDQVPICMYDSLRTNVPTDLMQFQGFKFQPESGKCYPSHAEVLKYIEKFARNFNLIPHIKFSHKVINISRRKEKWTVKVENVKNGEIFEQEFDGVMICTGHHSTPTYPSFPGMDTFLGHQMHSCNYRRNDIYKNKIVLLVGKGPSASDLCREVGEVAAKVFISHRGAHLNIRPKNIFQKPNIVKIDKNLIFFENGTTEFVDAIIYCTGYKYEFPFLDPSCGMTINKMILSPLYKYFINAQFPTMCFIFLVKIVVAFRLVDLQAEAFIKILTGRAKLPSPEEILSEVQKQYAEKIEANLVGTRFYVFESSEARRKYVQDLFELGNCDEPFPPVLCDIFDENEIFLFHEYDYLRNQIYEVIDNYTYKFQLKEEESK